MARVMDIALRVAGEFLGKIGQSATIVEGKDVEEYVRSFLEKEHLVNVREELKKSGFDIP